MASEIEVVTDELHQHTNGHNSNGAINGVVEGEERLKDDIYTASAYGDLDKLNRLVEGEGCSVSIPDGGGYFALQWAALNNRAAVAQYLIELEDNGSILTFAILPR